MKIENSPPTMPDRSLPMHELTARRQRRRIGRPPSPAAPALKNGEPPQLKPGDTLRARKPGS